MVESEGTVVGVQLSILGLFIAWVFQHSALFYVGSLFLIFGAATTFHHAFSD